MGGTTDRIYPKANTTAQWFEPLFDRATFTRIDKFLLHTTETIGWPGYSRTTRGDSAPNITYNPRTREFRQHNYANTSARALVDPSSTPVRENRDNVFQIEIICYTDLIKAASVGGTKVTDLTDDNLRDIAELYRWLNEKWDCPILCSLEFPPYRPYKNVRLTSSQFDAYRGLCGHMHASGNTHTDPGNINVGKIMKFALGLTSPTPVEDEVTPQDIDAIANAVLAKLNVEHPTLKTADGKAVYWPLPKATWSIWYYVLQEAFGDDVDEAAIATALAPLLKPAIEATVTEVLANEGVTGVDAAAVAAATVDLLAQRAAQ